MRRRSYSLCLFMFLGLFALCAGCEDKATTPDSGDATASPEGDDAPSTQTDS